jgi:hypothetical protein
LRGHWWLGMGDEERKERRKEVGRGEGEQRRDEGKRCRERARGKEGRLVTARPPSRQQGPPRSEVPACRASRAPS